MRENGVRISGSGNHFVAEPHAAKEVVEIKSVCDRLGNSVYYLKGVMKLGEFVSEVSSDWIETLINTLSFGFRSFILQ